MTSAEQSLLEVKVAADSAAAERAENGRPHFPQLPADLDPEVAAEINVKRREFVERDIAFLERQGVKFALKAQRMMAGRPARRRRPSAWRTSVQCFAQANALRELVASLPEEAPGG